MLTFVAKEFEKMKNYELTMKENRIGIFQKTVK